MAKKEREVYYEPHPVTPERKAELVKRGFRIVDSKYAPDTEKPAEKSKEDAEAEAKAKAKAKAEAEAKAKAKAGK